MFAKEFSCRPKDLLKAKLILLQFALQRRRVLQWSNSVACKSILPGAAFETKKSNPLRFICQPWCGIKEKWRLPSDASLICFWQNDCGMAIKYGGCSFPGSNATRIQTSIKKSHGRNLTVWSFLSHLGQCSVLWSHKNLACLNAPFCNMPSNTNARTKFQKIWEESGPN